MASHRSPWPILSTLVFLCTALLDGGCSMSPEVPQLAKTVQCLALNRTALLMEPGYNCTQLLDQFANVYTAFIGCSLENAHPTCMCEACVPFYREMKIIYEKIDKFDSKQSKRNSAADKYVAGHRCTEALLQGSKLGVIQSVVQFADSLWQDAACECCIRNGITVNDTTVLTPEALQFYWHLENLTKCMAEYTVIAEDLHYAPPAREATMPSVMPQADFNTMYNVCTACRNQYNQLLEYYLKYQKIVAEKGCSVCADIEDHINKTRLQWSQIYHCGRSSVSLPTVIGLGVAMLTLPVFFYLGACLCGTCVERQKKKERGQIPRSRHGAPRSPPLDLQTERKGSRRRTTYGAMAVDSPAPLSSST